LLESKNWRIVMKRPVRDKPTISVRDYSSALQRSLTWLGDRYLLANPVFPRRPDPLTLPVVRSARAPRR
jgi:hypothetical protein